MSEQQEERKGRKGRDSRTSTTEEGGTPRQRKKARGESSSSDSSRSPGSGESTSSAEGVERAGRAGGGSEGGRTGRQPRQEGEGGAGGSQGGPPGRGGRRPERPVVHTREPQYAEARLVESMNRMNVKENETIVTPNYYAISSLDGSRFRSDIQFHRYDVIFNPNVPRMNRGAVVDMFNDQYFKEVPLGFDGNAMAFAVANKVNGTDLMGESTTRTVTFKGRPIEVTLNKTTTTPLVADQTTQFVQALNTCLKRFLIRAHNLKPFLDSLWDIKNTITVNFSDRGRNTVYHIMKGYDITVKALQTGFLINVEDRMRIIKEGTVLQWAMDTRSSAPADYKRIIEDRLRNQILLNTIGSELIRVNAVHFDKHPSIYTFMWRRPVQGQPGQFDEKETTISEYYKERYNKDIAPKQPMIETVPFRRLRPNATDEERARYERQKNLIPADCLVFTGLDQSEKSNFQLMKKINESTKPSALRKKLDLDNIVRKYLLADQVRESMTRLQMKLTVADDAVSGNPPAHGLGISLVARLIKPPEIDMGGDVRSGQPGRPTQVQVTPGPNGPVINFETDTRGRLPVQKHGEEYRIAIVTTKRDEGDFMVFYNDFLIKAATNMGMGALFSGGQGKFYAEGQKSSDFSAAIEQCCNTAKTKNFMPFIFVCLPDELKERYDQVKQVSLAAFGYLSQCIKARTISRPNLSVATKVVLQVLAKMGTVKWALSKPMTSLANVMRSALIIGIDVHHDADRKGSVQACVGTLDPRASVFYQRSRLVAAGEELSKQSSQYSVYIKDMIRERHARNIKTETIILYRDGVGEGQMDMAIDTEYLTLKQALADWPTVDVTDCPYRAESVPKIVFIFVMKRHNTRFFQYNADGTEQEDVGGGGRGGGGDRGRGGRGGQSYGPPKKFDNPKPGTVVARGIVRSDRSEFYMATHDTKEGSLVPMRYEMSRNETQPPPEMSKADADAAGYRPVTQEDIETLTFYLTALYPNQCLKVFCFKLNFQATIRVPVVCQLAQKFAMLSGQHLHTDVVDMQTNLRKKMFYL